ncbi:MAG: hypothetical protein RLZZ430_1976 [Cyanobacteriota bacterium]|jgi:uncharacterized small protein (DUF1192 family)
MPEEPPDKLTKNIFGLDGPAKLFFTPMTTSQSQKNQSIYNSNGEYGSSLSPFRSFLSMLNCRPVKEIEQRTKQLEIEIEQLEQENAKGGQLLCYIDQLCSPPDSN